MHCKLEIVQTLGVASREIKREFKLNIDIEGKSPDFFS